MLSVPHKGGRVIIQVIKMMLEAFMAVKHKAA